MTIELDVDTAEPATPKPRRRDPRRWILAGIGGAMVLAAVVALLLGRPPAPPPPTPPVVVTLDGPLGWVEDLVDAPPRGSVAGDESFTRELVDRVVEALRANDYHRLLLGVDGRLHPEQEVKLLYADDVDDSRVVLLALRLPLTTTATADYDPIRNLPGRTKVVWMAGPRGAPASMLASVVTPRPEPGVVGGWGYAEPLLVALVGDDSGQDFITGGCQQETDCTMVALTPPGCTLATAPANDSTRFRPEPTGSYLVRTARTYRVEYWRVTCDGVVREERVAPRMWEPTRPSAEEVAAALADAPGLTAEQRTSDDIRRQTELTIDLVPRISGLPVTGPPRVLWVGPAVDLNIQFPGFAPNPTAMLMVTPSINPLWLAAASLHQGGEISVQVYLLEEAPGDLVAIPAPYAYGILAVPPPSATTVQVVAPGPGIQPSAAVHNGIAVLDTVTLGPSNRPVGEVVALDAAGNPVATTTIAAPSDSYRTYNWS